MFFNGDFVVEPLPLPNKNRKFLVMAFTPLSNSNREISSNFYDIPLPLLTKNKVVFINRFDLSMRYCFWYQTKYKDSKMFQGLIDKDVMKQDSSKNQNLHACILTY